MSCDLGMSLMGVSQKYRGPNTQSVDMLKFELLDFRRKPTSNSEVSFLGHIPIPMSQQHPLGRPHSEGSSRSCSAAKRERNGGSKGLPLNVPKGIMPEAPSPTKVYMHNEGL